MCAHKVFCRKLNSQQLLFEAFVNIIGLSLFFFFFFEKVVSFLTNGLLNIFLLNY